MPNFGDDAIFGFGAFVARTRNSIHSSIMAASSHDGARDDTPGQKSMFEGRSEGSVGAGGKRGPAHLKGTRALERLRDRIDLAVKELHRLREENMALRREVDALQRGGRADQDGTHMVFTESPDELRGSLEAYIRLVDELIEAENAGTETKDARS